MKSRVFLRGEGAAALVKRSCKKVHFRHRSVLPLRDSLQTLEVCSHFLCCPGSGNRHMQGLKGTRALPVKLVSGPCPAGITLLQSDSFRPSCLCLGAIGIQDEKLHSERRGSMEEREKVIDS